MATWKKIIVSGSSAELQSLYVSGSITGSGAGLYDIPASSITGLQLFQITSGSVSASVDTAGNIFTVKSGSDNILTLNDVGTLSLNGNLNLTNASIISSSGDLDIDTIGEINIHPQSAFIINGNEYIAIDAYGANSTISIGTYGNGDIDLYAGGGSVDLYGSENISLFASDGNIGIYGQLNIFGETESIIDLETNSVVTLRDSVMSLSGSSKIQIQASASLPNDVVTVKDLGLSSIFASTGSYQATTNDLQVTGSLIVTDGIIGSFTGSYSGSIYLKQDTILLGDVTNNASQVETQFYILDNVGSTFLTEAYLIANYPNAEIFQAVENNWQLAIKTAAGWSINKKNENELTSIDVDLSDTDIFTADGRILDIAHLSGVDIINFNTTFTPPEIIAISTADPAVVTVDNTQLLQNNRQFDIDSTTYEIKSIDHTAKTFDLYADDGTTAIDGSDPNIQALSGDTLTIPAGTDLIIRIDEILGVPNNFHLQATADSGNEVRFHRFAVATATTNQIVGESNGSSINIIGSDNGKNILRIRRSGTLNVVGKELIVA